MRPWSNPEPEKWVWNRNGGSGEHQLEVLVMLVHGGVGLYLVRVQALSAAGRML